MNKKINGAAKLDEIRRMLIAELATILQLNEADIDTAKPFEEYGLDSTDSVVVVGLVEERVGFELEPELLLRNRCIDEVVKSLREGGKIV